MENFPFNHTLNQNFVGNHFVDNQNQLIGNQGFVVNRGHVGNQHIIVNYVVDNQNQLVDNQGRVGNQNIFVNQQQPVNDQILFGNHQVSVDNQDTVNPQHLFLSNNQPPVDNHHPVINQNFVDNQPPVDHLVDIFGSDAASPTFPAQAGYPQMGMPPPEVVAPALPPVAAQPPQLGPRAQRRLGRQLPGRKRAVDASVARNSLAARNSRDRKKAMREWHEDEADKWELSLPTLQGAAREEALRLIAEHDDRAGRLKRRN